MESIASSADHALCSTRVLRQQPGIHPIAIPKQPERIAQLEAEALVAQPKAGMSGVFRHIASDTDNTCGTAWPPWRKMGSL